MNDSGYQTYRNLPELADLCSMDRANDGRWSVEESTLRLKRLHYVLRRLHEILTAKITAEPIYELKTAFSYHAYLCAEQVDLIRRRVAEMREPPLELDKVPHEGLQRCLDAVACCPDTESTVQCVYSVVIPEVIASCGRLQADAHPLADAPTVRVGRLIEFELGPLVEFGERAIQCLIDEETGQTEQARINYLLACFTAAGQLDGSAEPDGEVPPPIDDGDPNAYENEPQRDERFIDPYNAGVNAEAFLYHEQYSPQDKTVMMYYKRIRELDVPEMMASILVELRDEEPWEFHMEMSRQLWDEARHAMMGEIGFVSLGIDWQQIPINYTWSRNLNQQLSARERHGVLFFIEQTLMPKTGKRFEWEVATQSGEALSKLFQDFDWADEVLHAQIGRRWYVPKFESLKESLAYGDRCWSKVLSHWNAYREEGLTEHRNWWPEVYVQACQHWGKEPDPAALAFNETYEDKRADLEQIDS